MKRGLRINAIDKYISQYPDKFQEVLEELREVIHGAAPDAKEK